jgi:membrane protein
MPLRAAGLESARGRMPRRLAITFIRASGGFLRHGDLFSGAAISFYALFSLLPLTVLLLKGLQAIFSIGLVTRTLGRLFGGVADSDIVFRTVRHAYVQQGSLGWLGAVTLILAATGVFAAVQSALDRIWECRGRKFHSRFLVGIFTMAGSLLIFLATLVVTILAFRVIQSGQLGGVLGSTRAPRARLGSALNITTVLAQFGIFWTGYRFLPSVPVRWRDAWPGALVAAVVWHAIAYGLSWYIAVLADFATLYHELATIVALLVWVYGLVCSFLLGAEFVTQWTAAE